MNTLWALLSSAACAYLLGSISFAVIVSKLYSKKDVRDYGSGNAGMTNVLRNFGKLPAALTLLGDFTKGVVAVLLGRYLFSLFGVTAFDGAYVAGLFALLGHMYPLYFGFKGGKGVLTSAGIILVINPITLAVLLVEFLIAFGISKMVSLGSIVDAVSYPIVTYIVLKVSGEPALINTLFAALIGIIVLYLHRENIKRIFAGTEYKFGQKKEK
ncbi:glycerol-3-phosphate 1-O-acyltransferase PlsY [Zongyangia hominis]|uniref:Glycerol-3-phosphate acyltransferase n=1 Tax=Zongyangia hominis TaxID=2763677 RepID=A0A926EEZ5_9FIRM|nr:glycerol-3-phosphate 1-O-acyltransferase PlsY [Zongyangia hominis]MBC8570939.1 glycerol-3-phosphate 1-O-acyltransferase PlsY [Zongyangia hominis]